MKISEEEIKAALEIDGTPWSDFFVFNSLVIAHRDANGTLYGKIIEDDYLAEAVMEFLISKGKVQSHA